MRERRQAAAAAATTTRSNGKEKNAAFSAPIISCFERLSLPLRKLEGPLLHPRTSKRQPAVGRRGDLAHPSSLAAGRGGRPFLLPFFFPLASFVRQVDRAPLAIVASFSRRCKKRNSARRRGPLAPRITSRLSRGAEKSLRRFSGGRRGPVRGCTEADATKFGASSVAQEQ